MTLAISIVAGDGITVAADSRTSLQPTGAQFRVLSDFTHKVFRVKSVAVATYGYAFLSGRNIAGHMAEFGQRFAESDNPSALEVANSVAEFFGDRFDRHMGETKETPIPAGASALGFLVGGYDGGLGCLHEVALPARSVTNITDSTKGGGAWRGMTDVVIRMIKGVDLNLVARHVQTDGLDAHYQALQPVFSKLEYSIPFGQMNLQDAVDFATLLIRTTIDVQRLTHGTAGSFGSWPGVGGPIEVATVTATSGFQWVQKTEIQAERPSGVADRI
jgi:hypothetical protein